MGKLIKVKSMGKVIKVKSVARVYIKMYPLGRLDIGRGEVFTFLGFVSDTAVKVRTNKGDEIIMLVHELRYLNNTKVKR